MKRRVAIIALVAAVLGVLLFQINRDDRHASAESALTIYSTTDSAAFAPVVADFRKLYPEIAVRYEELEAAPLYRRFLEEARSGRPGADLLLSSAMDLQAKLVNDGYAAAHLSDDARGLPDWARWRDEAFGFTFEPAVMVFSRTAMRGRPLPQSRAELLAALRADPAFWQNRIGTYEISTSSVGYLLASQDIRQSHEFRSLIEAFGKAGVRTGDKTATLLDRLERGELAMGYNLLGSYASQRVDAGASLTIVYPKDYTLAVSRTAILPRNAPHPRSGHLFLDYLLSLRGQSVLASRSGLSAIRGEIQDAHSRMGLSARHVGVLRPIALGPGLLVYLDQRKQQHLLESWRSGVDQHIP